MISDGIVIYDVYCDFNKNNNSLINEPEEEENQERKTFRMRKRSLYTANLERERTTNFD